MVPPGENFCPGWPHDQLLVVDHLVGLVGAGDQLGGVTDEEHQHNGGEEGGHGGVATVVSGYRIVEYCRSESKSFLKVSRKHIVNSLSNSFENEIIENREKNNWNKAHHQEVTKLKICLYYSFVEFDLWFMSRLGKIDK